MDVVAGSRWAWYLAGGYSGVRGRLVSAAWVVGRAEVVSQRWRWPLQLPARWTLALTSLRGERLKLGFALVFGPWLSVG